MKITRELELISAKNQYDKSIEAINRKYDIIDKYPEIKDKEWDENNFLVEILHEGIRYNAIVWDNQYESLFLLPISKENTE